jgi:hypothetical protein
MSRDDELSKRPDRVIILDAEDPMTEVHGRFVWQDEHERVVDEVRRMAFTEGYEAGVRDHSTASQGLRLNRRHPIARYIRLTVLMLLALLVILMLPIIFG